MTTRQYSSPLREAEAAATRERIVDAASELFVRDGYGVTSMRAIAQAAGVSAQTVALQGAKHTLLLAAYERALAQSEGWTTLNETESMRSIISEPDIERVLDRYSAYMADANSRIASIVRTLRAAADSDPAVRETYRAIEQRRLFSIREGVKAFASRGLFGQEQINEVAAVQSMLVSHDTYLHFRDAGWSSERYRLWLREQLSQLRD